MKYEKLSLNTFADHHHQYGISVILLCNFIRNYYECILGSYSINFPTSILALVIALFLFTSVGIPCELAMLADM